MKYAVSLDASVSFVDAEVIGGMLCNSADAVYNSDRSLLTGIVNRIERSLIKRLELMNDEKTMTTRTKQHWLLDLTGTQL